MCKLCTLSNHTGIEKLFFDHDLLSITSLLRISASCNALRQKLYKRLQPVSIVIEALKLSMAPFDYNVYMKMDEWTYGDYKRGVIHDCMDWWLYGDDDDEDN